MEKSKLLIFKSKEKKLNADRISIIFSEVKLIPSDNVKCQGLHLDKYLSWDLQETKKLSRAFSQNLETLCRNIHLFQYIT